MAVENGVQNAELGYLLFPFEQYSNLAGKPLVGGHMEIFEAGTDTKYISYQNWDGAENPFKIPLPADGRITVLADPTKTFDCYLYDSYNNLVCSRLNVQCCVPGNISIKGADTILKNTDGTLDIYLRTLGNNVREYTVNTHNKILDVQEPLYFVENSNTATVIGISGGTVPEGTMNESALGYQDGQITGYNGSPLGGNSTLTLRTNGIKDGTYDTLGTYTPQGGAKNIDIPREVYTFTIGNNSCFYNDVIMAYLNSKVVVALEIESWYEDGQQKQNVYENFAQKQFWGNNNFYNGGYVNFVRVDVEKNQIVTWKCEPETQGSITGYAKWTKTVTDLGSGGLFIAEYGNPGTTYEEIDAAFNAGKTVIAHKKDGNIDQYYQLCEIRKYPDLTPNVDCYVFAYRYSYIVEELFRFQSNWSNMETRLATWDYVNQQISAGDFATHDDLTAYQTVDGMSAYQPSGDYATNTDLQEVSAEVSGKQDKLTILPVAAGDNIKIEESGNQIVISTNLTGTDYVERDELSAYQTTADMTAYATTSLVSSVSSELYSAISGISGDYELVAGSGVELVDDPNAKTTTINVTAQGGNPEVEAEVIAHSANWNTVGDKLDTTAFSTVSGNFLTAHQSLDGYATTEDVESAVSSKLDTTAFSDVSGSFLTAHQDISDLMPKSESANFYPMTGNPSGFLTEHQDLSDYQLTADMTAYATVESLTSKQDAGDYYSASNPSGFISEVPDTYLQNTDLTVVDNKITEISGVPLSAGDELPSGVMNTSALEYNAVNEISGYNGSAIAQYGAEKQWLVHDDTLVHAANSAQYALGVNLSAVAKLLGVDETVLFESTSGGALSGSFTENLTNFNYIEFFCNRVNTTANSNLAGSLKIAMVGTGVPSEVMLQAGLHTGPSAMFVPCEFFDLTNSGFAWQAGYNATVNRTGYSGTNIITLDFKNFGITKVVGIGRKS